MQIEAFRYKRFFNILGNCFIIAFLVSVFVIVICRKDLPHLSSDSYWYIELAEGRPYNVVRPFSSRILHPAVVRAISGIGNLNTSQSFFVVGFLALVALITEVLLMLRLTTPYPPVIGVAIVFTPFLLHLFRDYYLPDLFHASLLGLFLILLMNQKLWASLLILLLLHLTRESTILLSLCIVLVSLYKSQRRYAIAVFVITAIGMVFTSIATRLGQPNIHEINALLYMLFKIPFNFSKNILGVQLWTNTLALRCSESFPHDPIFTVSIPSWLRLGSIRAIGIYDFNPLRPLKTLQLLLTLFGIAPTLVIFSLKKVRKQILINNSVWFLVALMYGLVSFFVGTSLGTSVRRLIGYGWPAFWLVTPVLMVRYYYLDRRYSIHLLLYHVILCWVPWFVNYFQVRLALSIGILLFVAFLIHYLAFKTLHEMNNRIL
ncbi:MAG: hypothetical protein ACTSYD_11425 [Candidatus Heimdallarchaeaceae archaeon]